MDDLSAERALGVRHPMRSDGSSRGHLDEWRTPRAPGEGGRIRLLSPSVFSKFAEARILQFPSIYE